ncbi:hypothetical protein EMIHUDRAFT_193983 [Emiliania huxleyi CCMP1516]|uniref:Uncharacterized protein n=2 Tax=Emiliania huxleyi TaxID=2903 RepID=A0A0D3L0R9_EMIH1|nr:hypothetical protein EMIHUDRAFT_193983 [Emiliania huxleyi CCMP1516]EOD41604.1 hypothetical protein EMIHUDRAFT_193983 [Emiliania huxleyi CCMP1516]|eukprot:XP_005794033.1 hypothetical protein EMIHUDRAFT_193983 [Emiliania huxleyi CCMP1516]
MSTAEVLSLSDSAEETVDLSASLSQLELSGEVVERPQGVGGDDLSGHLSDTADLSTSGLHLGSHFEPALPPDAPARAAPAPPAPLNPFLAESAAQREEAKEKMAVERRAKREASRRAAT